MTDRWDAGGGLRLSAPRSLRSLVVISPTHVGFWKYSPTSDSFFTPVCSVQSKEYSRSLFKMSTCFIKGDIHAKEDVCYDEGHQRLANP